MSFHVKQLFRCTGTISRGPYALIGILGFALKHNLDRLVAHFGFNRPWDLFNYWVPVHDVVRIWGHFPGGPPGITTDSGLRPTGSSGLMRSSIAFICESSSIFEKKQNWGSVIEWRLIWPCEPCAPVVSEFRALERRTRVTLSSPESSTSNKSRSLH